MLIKKDMEASRTQIELAEWVDVTRKELGKSKEGRKAARLNQGDCVKQFNEELQPMRRYADAFYKGDVNTKFELVIGSQPYDVIVRGSDNEVLYYLEITLSIDGYQHRLRMEHLNSYNRVPMRGVIHKRDKDRYVQEARTESVDKKDTIADEFEQILAAFENKSEKRYGKDTILVIDFSSSCFIDKEYIQCLDEFVKDQILKNKCTFKELAFVSGIEGCNLKYRIPD